MTKTTMRVIWQKLMVENKRDSQRCCFSENGHAETGHAELKTVQKTLVLIWLIFLSAFIVIVPFSTSGKSAPSSQLQANTTNMLSILGNVNSPLNLSLAELRSFPVVSEIAELKCVQGSPDVTYNWTGIPLFYLLTLAQIQPQTIKLGIHASDGFSSDLWIEDALKPTTILALGANGTDLPTIGGIQGAFRLVVPGQWGYKWVGNVDQIQAVDYDYKGTYEGLGGFPDLANISDSPVMPNVTPPIEELNFESENRTFTMQTFTNVSIISHAFDYQEQELGLNVTVPSGTTGVIDFNIEQDFLQRPYNVSVDMQPVNVAEGDLANRSYVWIPLTEGAHTIRIAGTNTALPEFEPIPLTLLFLAITLVAVLLFKKSDAQTRIRRLASHGRLSVNHKTINRLQT
jgi:hypothetical protein